MIQFIITGIAIVVLVLFTLITSVINEVGLYNFISVAVLIIGSIVAIKIQNTLIYEKYYQLRKKQDAINREFNEWYQELMNINEIIEDREQWASNILDRSSTQMRLIKERDELLEHQMCLLMKNFKLS